MSESRIMSAMLAFAFAMPTLATAASAQAPCTAFQGYDVQPINPDGAKRRDQLAAALRPVVKGRRVVMLGEPSHGDGQSIVSRAELVEVLHERFGFDVLVFEGDFFGLGADWRHPADDSVQAAKENLYPFWSTSRASQKLWLYLDALSRDRQMHLAGLDIRLGGPLARERLPQLLEAMSLQQNVAFAEPAQKALEDLLEGDNSITATQSEKAALSATLSALALARDVSSPDGALVRSVQAWTDYAWNGASRDVGMAANLRWLADHRYAGHRIIVWAHSNHIIRDQAFWSTVPGSGEAPRHLGNIYAEGRQSTVATIATVASGGAISREFFKPLNWSKSGWAPYNPALTTPIRRPQPDSLEHFLGSACPSNTMINLRRGKTLQPFLSSAVDYMAPLKARYNLAYDMLFYTGKATGLNLD